MLVHCWRKLDSISWELLIRLALCCLMSSFGKYKMNFAGGSLISHQLLAADRHGNILTRETSDSWCCCCRKGGITHLLTPTMQGRALCQPFQLTMRASCVEGADRAACASPSTLCVVAMSMSVSARCPGSPFFSQGSGLAAREIEGQLGTGWVD